MLWVNPVFVDVCVYLYCLFVCLFVYLLFVCKHPGSEKTQKDSVATAEHLQESNNINRSLLVLGKYH